MTVLLELQATVATCPRFCFFIQIYVHLGVAQGTTSSIAGYDSMVHLVHGLLGYQINGKALIHLFLTIDKPNPPVVFFIINFVLRWSGFPGRAGEQVLLQAGARSCG